MDNKRLQHIPCPNCGGVLNYKRWDSYYDQVVCAAPGCDYSIFVQKYTCGYEMDYTREYRELINSQQKEKGNRLTRILLSGTSFILVLVMMRWSFVFTTGLTTHFLLVADHIETFKKQLKKGIIEEWRITISNVGGCVPYCEVVKPPLKGEEVGYY